MNFEMLNYNDYSGVGFIGLVITLICAAILFMIAIRYVGKFDPEKSGFFFICACALAVSGGVAFGVLAMVDNSVNNQNKEKATGNIKVKYEVKDVLWDAPETTTSPIALSSERTISLEANNGQQYVFKYSVNKETSEPTLKNMPIQGGNTSDKETSAEALLRK